LTLVEFFLIGQLGFKTILRTSYDHFRVTC
jgi:hypothetical protein